MTTPALLVLLWSWLFLAADIVVAHGTQPPLIVEKNTTWKYGDFEDGTIVLKSPSPVVVKEGVHLTIQGKSKEHPLRILFTNYNASIHLDAHASIELTDVVFQGVLPDNGNGTRSIGIEYIVRRHSAYSGKTTVLATRFQCYGLSVCINAWVAAVEIRDSIFRVSGRDKGVNGYVAVYCDSGNISNSSFFTEEATAIQAALMGSKGTTVIRNCSFHGMQSSSYAVRCGHARCHIMDSTFEGHYGSPNTPSQKPPYGGGIAVWGSSEGGCHIQDCIFAGNRKGVDGCQVNRSWFFQNSVGTNRATVQSTVFQENVVGSANIKGFQDVAFCRNLIGIWEHYRYLPQSNNMTFCDNTVAILASSVESIQPPLNFYRSKLYDIHVDSTHTLGGNSIWTNHYIQYIGWKNETVYFASGLMTTGNATYFHTFPWGNDNPEAKQPHYHSTFPSGSQECVPPLQLVKKIETLQFQQPKNLTNLQDWYHGEIYDPKARVHPQSIPNDILEFDFAALAPSADDNDGLYPEPLVLCGYVAMFLVFGCILALLRQTFGPPWLFSTGKTRFPETHHSCVQKYDPVETDVT